jgi:hypothetical protein
MAFSKVKAEFGDASSSALVTLVPESCSVPPSRFPRDLHEVVSEVILFEAFIAKRKIERASIAIQNMLKAHGAPATPVQGGCQLTS